MSPIARTGTAEESTRGAPDGVAAPAASGAGTQLARSKCRVTLPRKTGVHVESDRLDPARSDALPG